MSDLSVTREDTGVEIKPFTNAIEGVCAFCGAKTFAKLDEGEEPPKNMVCQVCVEVGVLLLGNFKKYKDGMFLAGINKFGEDMKIRKWVAYKNKKSWGIRWGEVREDNLQIAMKGTLLKEVRKIKMIARCEDAMLKIYEEKL
jgi:hypothetical protein